jgi:hypothetical protein
MVRRFLAVHGRLPDKIVVAPVALVALGLKQSVAPVWEGVPVECRLFHSEEVSTRKNDAKVECLGVFVRESRGKLVLAACGLIDRATS